MTYISTRSLSYTLHQSALQQQSDYAKAQTEASTGKYADLGQALGYTTGLTVSLTQDQARLQAITDTNTFVSTRLSATQTGLTNLNTTAQSMLNALISNSTAEDNASQSALSAQATGGLQTLIGTLNTTVDGKYIFGGINSSTKPLADYSSTPTSAAKQAVDAAFTSTFGFAPTDPAAANISGADMQSFLQNQFAGLFSGPSWTANWSQASDTPQTSRISTSQTISTSVSANNSGFQKLAQAYTMLSEFGGGKFSDAATQAVKTTARGLLGTAVGDVTGIQTSVGVAQSSVSQANDAITAQMSVLTTSLNSLESVDPYEAATRVSNLQTQLQATYQLTARLQQMSLLNYLSNA